MKLADGTFWKNIVTEEVVEAGGDAARVPRALSLQPARRARAPLQRRSADDRAVGRSRGAEQLVPGEVLGDDRRRRGLQGEARRHARPASRSRRSIEYAPLRAERRRAAARVPQLRVRSARSSSSCSTAAPIAAQHSRTARPQAGADTAMLGPSQLAWLKQALAQSTRAVEDRSPATCRSASSCRTGRLRRRRSPTPIRRCSDASTKSPTCCASCKARPCPQRRLFITADVHYAAAHEYHPTRATFTDFDPFWEFVAGPLHAGTFGTRRPRHDVRAAR